MAREIQQPQQSCLKSTENPMVRHLAMVMKGEKEEKKFDNDNVDGFLTNQEEHRRKPKRSSNDSGLDLMVADNGPLFGVRQPRQVKRRRTKHKYENDDDEYTEGCKAERQDKEEQKQAREERRHTCSPVFVDFTVKLVTDPAQKDATSIQIACDRNSLANQFDKCKIIGLSIEHKITASFPADDVSRIFHIPKDVIEKQKQNKADSHR